VNIVSPHIGAGALLLLSGVVLAAQPVVMVDHNDGAAATPAFHFKRVPPPCKNDAASNATFVLVDGVIDGNSGKLGVLHDGKLPAAEDEPAENFFFDAGTKGGRLLVDLRDVLEIKQVNTYSWHAGPRGPQVYALYGSDGQPAGFEARPKDGTVPQQCGWKAITRVDTRQQYGLAAGQYGVSISGRGDALGRFRYLLFVVSCTETQNEFGNTFFSEIDILDRNAREPAQPVTVAPPPPDLRRTFASEGGQYQITIDPSRAPDLADWAFTELAPVVQDWYPRIVKLLPSDGFVAPAKVTIDFGTNVARSTAITSGTHVTCNAAWFRKNLRGEAKGCVVHELVHVVQHYGNGRPRQPNAVRAPGWLTEGIPDYIRWFLFEPEARGADVSVWYSQRARYDDSYRVTANFLNWVTRRYDPDLVPQLNIALRNGTYNPDLWKQRTGHDLEALGAEWREAVVVRRKPKTPSS
jgi:hypothetical protein